MLDIPEIIRVMENHLTNLRNMHILASTALADLIVRTELETKIWHAERAIEQLRTLLE